MHLRVAAGRGKRTWSDAAILHLENKPLVALRGTAQGDHSSFAAHLVERLMRTWLFPNRRADSLSATRRPDLLFDHFLLLDHRNGWLWGVAAGIVALADLDLQGWGGG